ncbi:MAG: hypothetical protein HY231_03220 [Acidobacteria bacterium]|nr:hypothetical protein [Acidobacteriota bacterium]
MLLPMMGFTFALMVFGGLGSLVHIATTRVDPYSRSILLYSFSAFYAGLGAFTLSLGLLFLVEHGFGFLFGYLGGGLAGGLLGHRIATKRIRKLKIEL